VAEHNHEKGGKHTHRTWIRL